MIDFLKENIKGVILDMDGVLWKDSEPIGNLPSIFQRFTDYGFTCYSGNQ